MAGYVLVGVAATGPGDVASNSSDQRQLSFPHASTHPAATRRPPRPRQSTTGSKQCSKKPPSPSYTCRWEEKHTTQQISKIIRSEKQPHCISVEKTHRISQLIYPISTYIRYQKSLSPTRIKQKNRIKPNRLLAHSSTHKTRQTMTDTNALHVLLPHCGFGCCVHAMKYSICVFDECVF